MQTYTWQIPPPKLWCITTLASVHGRKHWQDTTNKQFASYICQGLRQGFCIGFRRGRSILKQAHSNMKIADLQAVRAYLTNELEEDWLLQMSPAKMEAINIYHSSMENIQKRTSLGNGTSYLTSNPLLTQASMTKNYAVSQTSSRPTTWSQFTRWITYYL